MNLFPKTKVEERYAYVKNGIIFKISYQKDENDSCAVKITSGNVPSFEVKEANKEEKDIYYLDEYIEVGDVYSGTSESKTFKKTIHGEEETVKELNEYYVDLCNDEINKKIRNALPYNWSCDRFLISDLNVPSYVVKQKSDGATVDGLSQIDLTEEEYNTRRETQILEVVHDKAQNTAEEFGYDVNTLTIKPQEEEG